MSVPYGLGIDVGTTFTAAAISRGGFVETFSLGTYEVAVPSVIYVDGGEVLFGLPAARRGATRPDGVAREFKRRIGDPVPLMLGGTPYHADRLTAMMARWVVETVSEQVGDPPASVTMTHPVHWTSYQVGTLATALTEAGLDAELMTEPGAAAVDYAATTNLADGAQLLIYDLGGGTFDVAVLVRHGNEFRPEIEPFGIARLGGIDFDEAVFHHVTRQLPPERLQSARETPEGLAALAKIRQDCVDAKVALSSDPAADIPVMLAGYNATIRVTRPEFETMIRPLIEQTLEGVDEILRRGSLRAADLDAVLLIGGSSRIPLVSELVAGRIGAPVRIDAHPKLVVAKGAARHASEVGRRPPSQRRPRDDDETEGRRWWPGWLRRDRGVDEEYTGHDEDDDEERRRWPLVVGGLLVAGVIGAGTWALTRPDDETASTVPPVSSAPVASTVAVQVQTTTSQAATTTSTTTIPLGARRFLAAPLCPTLPAPLDIALVGTDVWVTSSDTATLQRCDGLNPGQPKDAVVFGPVPQTANNLTGYELVAMDDALFVTQREASSVARIDLETLAVEQTLAGGQAFGAAVLDGQLWVGVIGTNGPSRLVRIGGAEQGAGIDLPFGPGYLRAIDGLLWVHALGGDQVARIDPTTRAVDVFDLTGEPLDFVKVGDQLWVPLRQANEIAILDPATGQTLERFAVGTSPTMAIEAFGSVWVTNAGDGTVSRLDPVTHAEVQPPIEVGAGPVAIVAGPDRLYVANLSGDSIDVLVPDA